MREQDLCVIIASMCAYAIKCNRCVTFDHVNVAPKLNTSPTHVHDACATNVGMMEIEGVTSAVREVRNHRGLV